MPITALPYTIAAAGSYCLSGDLVSSATGTAAAITIAVDDVQLDLNGHSITGPGGTAAGTGVYAISRHNVQVRNGILRGFSYGVYLTDAYSVIPPFVGYSGYSKGHDIATLRVEGAKTGIFVVGRDSRVHDNTVVDSSDAGISAAAVAGAYFITGNVVSNINVHTPTSATGPIYGISAGGIGTLVQDNVISNLRGPTGSAAIYAIGFNYGPAAMIVSRNRESNYGTAWAVYCSGIAPVPKVESNIGTTGGTNGITGCAQLGTNY